MFVLQWSPILLPIFITAMGIRIISNGRRAMTYSSDITIKVSSHISVLHNDIYTQIEVEPHLELDWIMCMWIRIAVVSTCAILRTEQL